jgi:hypothetical protein
MLGSRPSSRQTVAIGQISAHRSPWGVSPKTDPRPTGQPDQVSGGQIDILPFKTGFQVRPLTGFVGCDCDGRIKIADAVQRFCPYPRPIAANVLRKARSHPARIARALVFYPSSTLHPFPPVRARRTSAEEDVAKSCCLCLLDGNRISQQRKVNVVTPPMV